MADNGSTSKITADGVDCQKEEEYPFETKWWSHKFNGPALRFEVGIAIQTGDCVWLNGPFPPAPFPDGKIAKEMGLWDMLDEGETFVCDGVYYGEKANKPTGLNNDLEWMKKNARNRHETFNGRLKKYGALNQPFRHGVEKQAQCFLAIAKISQIVHEVESPLYQVHYIDI